MTDTAAAEAFWIIGPARGEIRETPLFQFGSAGPETVEVETLYSAISRGTESLVFHDRIPKSEFQRMRAPFQAGGFPYPVCYGYANVGRVLSGPAHLVGKTVFSLFPHQTRYRVPADAVTVLPEGVPPERAVLAANMETAVNSLWDAEPGIGDRIAIIGCGVVGSLVAWLASRIPGVRVTAIDTDPAREPVLAALGLDLVSQPEEAGYDLVIHASGQPGGLKAALELAGQEARIVEMSWFGNREVSLPLGEAFHARRLTIRSSQVGGINPIRNPRWGYSRRLALALSLLDEPALDSLISGESAFEDLPETMARVCQPGSGELCHRVVYPAARR
ncbi:zinc-binding alcohol dehydrogenase [Marinobacter sp.]|uniref:zinc-dependent alcohol dehydrogenase n=1 Tax=Marinobacter sp. TaxID=50741 RepID=UPI0038513AB2